jgi:hypothetical protein
MLQLRYFTLSILPIPREAFYLHSCLSNIFIHPLLLLLYIFQTLPSKFFSSISDTFHQITSS